MYLNEFHLAYSRGKKISLLVMSHHGLPVSVMVYLYLAFVISQSHLTGRSDLEIEIIQLLVGDCNVSDLIRIINRLNLKLLQ